MGKNFRRRSHFDQAARVHHSDAVRHLRDHGKIVGDEQHRQRKFLAQLAEQVEHLRLDGDIERGRRLVGNQQRRPVHHGHGNHHPLPLPAGELVRIIARAPLGLGNGDGAQRLDRKPPGVGLAGGRAGLQARVKPLRFLSSRWALAREGSAFPHAPAPPRRSGLPRASRD